MAAPNFNVETLIKSMYDKEVTGMQIRKDEIKDVELRALFGSWNEHQN